MKPGSCGPAALGIYAVIYDEDGNEIPAGSGKAGNICIRNPWPGIFQTIWGQPERFVDAYYRKYNKDPDSKDWHDWPYFAGDGAVQAADGYFRILGRVDDVINVAGHRLGTKELESAALTVHEVAEAAAVPVVDDIRGRAVEMYVSLKPGVDASRRWRPRSPRRSRPRSARSPGRRTSGSCPTCPRPGPARSCAGSSPSVSNFTDVGDVTTLANPEVVDGIRHQVQSAKVAKGEAPRELTETEQAEIESFGTE